MRLWILFQCLGDMIELFKKAINPVRSRLHILAHFLCSVVPTSRAGHVARVVEHFTKKAQGPGPCVQSLVLKEKKKKEMQCGSIIHPAVHHSWVSLKPGWNWYWSLLPKPVLYRF
jgi:hypothetical protein